MLTLPSPSNICRKNWFNENKICDRLGKNLALHVNEPRSDRNSCLLVEAGASLILAILSAVGLRLLVKSCGLKIPDPYQRTHTWSASA